MRSVLAIDQSTSATKALLYDELGGVLDREARSHRQYYPQPGWVEHDAEEIWQNTLLVAGAIVQRLDKSRAIPLCLSITNQRETIVVFERSSGRPLCPALVWLDRRGDEICREHATAGRDEWVRKKTGLTLDGYFSGSKLAWLMRNRTDLREKVAAGEALIGTIDTYLIYRLTGGSVFATDPTNASRTLLFDILRLEWDDRLCELWEVPKQALAQVRASTTHFGETTIPEIFPVPLPICGIMGDSQASLFAHRCFQIGDAKVTFGTGSSVLLNIGPEPEIHGNGIVTTLAWILDGSPTYALEGIIISSAATLAWLIDQLGIVKDVAEIERLASSLNDNQGVYLVPAFSGLGLPHWRPDARAAILGMTGQSDRRHVSRAALESITYQLRDVLSLLRQTSGRDITRLRADGGATANRLLMQFTADITGLELRVASTPDCSSLGAALAGLLGCGVYSSLEELPRVLHAGNAYRPSMPATAVASNCAGWQRALEQVLA